MTLGLAALALLLTIGLGWALTRVDYYRWLWEGELELTDALLGSRMRLAAPRSGESDYPALGSSNLSVSLRSLDRSAPGGGNGRSERVSCRVDGPSEMPAALHPGPLSSSSHPGLQGSRSGGCNTRGGCYEQTDNDPRSIQR
jgi:hypothetical protein